MKIRPTLFSTFASGAVCAAGLSIICLSLLRLEPSSLDASFVALALTSICVRVRIGLKNSKEGEHLPLFYHFVFVGLLLFDPGAIFLMTAMAATAASLKENKTLVSVFFNATLPVLSVFLIYRALIYYFQSPSELILPWNIFITLTFSCLALSIFHWAAAKVDAQLRESGAVHRLSAGGYLRVCLTSCALLFASGFIVKLITLFNLSRFRVIAAWCGVTLLIYLGSLFVKSRLDQRHDTCRELRPEPVREAAGIYQSAFECASIGMSLVSGKGRCLLVNRALCGLLGYSDQELKSINIHSHIHPDSMSKFQIAFSQIFQEGAAARQIEVRFIHQEGHEIWTLCDISKPNSDESGADYLICQIQDISKQKISEESLIHNAYHDPLTGLPNRSLFIDHLQLAIDRIQRHDDRIYAVLFIDLDRFKIINDSLGHLIGDHLLVEIARRLETCLRPGDTIARVGGDEFTVLLEDLQDEPEAVSIANRIQRELSTPFIIDGHEIFNSVSIGIAPNSPSYHNPAQIMRDADTAMYRAKMMGKNRHVIFDNAMHEAAVGLLQMETDLRHALEREEFFIQYQPIVSLDDFRLCGFEALVRWQHPERGLISPLDFIPLAEDTGQIIPIGKWVLGKACKQMFQWQNRYGMEHPLFMSVNISGKQFTQSNLVEQIISTIAETRLNPRGLKLEITESVVMENVETAPRMLHQLRDLGVQLSIDDFGTGYSSLSYLHRFPIDTLKIDKSFIMKMVDNTENIEIVRTIIMLAQNLGMDVIAEGVETKEQLALLRKLKCEKGQGYYFSKPLEISDAENLLVETCTEGNLLNKARKSQSAPLINTRVKSMKLMPVEDRASLPGSLKII